MGLYDSSVPIPPHADRAHIFNLSGSPGIDSEESIPPGWESIPGLLKRFTNTGSFIKFQHCYVCIARTCLKTIKNNSKRIESAAILLIFSTEKMEQEILIFCTLF
jgi:hypothetical protein